MAKQYSETPIHGDILQVILSHVPLIDLVHASHVSKYWNISVYSSLHHFNTIKPWLTVYSQSTRSPYSTTTHVYDPRSHLWFQIHQPSFKYISALRSSHSTLLYMLSPSNFAFSLDPLKLTWHQADPPQVWRNDPIVAHVGHHIIVAGGACDFEDDPLAVELYDLNTRKWVTCKSMPTILKDSAASTWLSIAVDHTRMYITEKSSGITYSFDPKSKTWNGPFDLCPDHGTVFSSMIGFANDRLIMVGLLGNVEDMKGVKMWEMSGELMEYKEIGMVPKRLVEKLNGDGTSMSLIEMTAMDNFVYLHNQCNPGEMIQCEMVKGECRWSSIGNMAVNDGGIMQRVVMACANVGMGDLCSAMRIENLNFVVKRLDDMALCN